MARCWSSPLSTSSTSWPTLLRRRCRSRRSRRPRSDLGDVHETHGRCSDIDDDGMQYATAAERIRPGHEATETGDGRSAAAGVRLDRDFVAAAKEPRELRGGDFDLSDDRGRISGCDAAQYGGAALARPADQLPGRC